MVAAPRRPPAPSRSWGCLTCAVDRPRPWSSEVERAAPGLGDERDHETAGYSSGPRERTGAGVQRPSDEVGGANPAPVRDRAGRKIRRARTQTVVAVWPEGCDDISLNAHTPGGF